MCDLLLIIVQRLKNEQIWTHLQAIIDNMKVLMMDEVKEIQYVALEIAQNLIIKSSEIVYHYVEIIGRALLPSLVSKNSRLRVKSLETFC